VGRVNTTYKIDNQPRKTFTFTKTQVIFHDNKIFGKTHIMRRKTKRNEQTRFPNIQLKVSCLKKVKQNGLIFININTRRSDSRGNFNDFFCLHLILEWFKLPRNCPLDIFFYIFYSLPYNHQPTTVISSSFTTRTQTQI
jgi:hypothetical protein